MINASLFDPAYLSLLWKAALNGQKLHVDITWVSGLLPVLNIYPSFIYPLVQEFKIDLIDTTLPQQEYIRTVFRYAIGSVKCFGFVAVGESNERKFVQYNSFEKGRYYLDLVLDDTKEGNEKLQLALNLFEKYKYRTTKKMKTMGMEVLKSRGVLTMQKKDGMYILDAIPLKKSTDELIKLMEEIFLHIHNYTGCVEVYIAELMEDV
jgi:hypothetical protein